MRLRVFAFCCSLFAVLLIGGFGNAQQQGRIYKVGWLSARGASNVGQQTIIRMLRELGYVEGKNISFEF